MMEFATVPSTVPMNLNDSKNHRIERLSIKDIFHKHPLLCLGY